MMGQLRRRSSPVVRFAIWRGQISNVAIGPYTDPVLGSTVGVYADFTPTATTAGDVAFGLIKSAVAQREAGVSSPLVGFSINAYGVGEPRTINGEEYNVVDRITECVSVDAVTRAGAGGGVVSLLEAQRRRENPYMRQANALRAAGLLPPRDRRPGLFAPHCTDEPRVAQYPRELFAPNCTDHIPLREKARTDLFAPNAFD